MVLLREAKFDDMQVIFEWRNTPFIKNLSSSQKKVTREEHENWFLKALNDINKKIFIIEIDSISIGLSRFDKYSDTAVISLYVIQTFTGKGYGVTAIKEATKKIFQIWSLKKVVAQVRVNNIHGYKGFVKAGYKKEEDPAFQLANHTSLSFSL